MKAVERKMSKMMRPLRILTGVKGRFFKEYLQGNPLWLQYVKVPSVTLGYENSYDVFVKAHGGGLSGQAQAITLGVARALLKVSADHRSPLKKEGLLTRDARVVERKKEYLQGNPLWLQYVKVPSVTLGYENSYDVFVKAHGGGLSGQAQAITLGVARALLKVSADHRSPLKKEGLLTRDARVVERKKVGLKKARKAPQFSKR
ncbi:hypothetical protein F2Q68_00045525 [Brassica cretica]|uniref:30S ribosomal protein S9, chloroplastic n=1 Tax=Brassica cretica TaxID=69181 RepID=A0A8S9LFV6_BRACR|nr:hypothetical protein F2Q68_00045525 [Brassica cretica]